MATIDLPSPREAAWLFRRADEVPASLTTAEYAYVTRLCQQCPTLGRVQVLAATFVAMCRMRDANAVTPWLQSACGTELQTFVTGIEHDRDVLRATLCFRWSTAQVEGHVQGLKVLKRGMYGQGEFDLLRKHVPQCCIIMINGRVTHATRVITKIGAEPISDHR